MAKNGTEGATHVLRLVRAGRSNASNIEEVQPPATVYDVQAFFEAAARLYPQVTIDKIGVRVTTQDEFNKGEITPAVIEELATDSIRWHHLVANIFPSAEDVYVIPAYVGSSAARDCTIFADCIKSRRNIYESSIRGSRQ